MVDWYRVTSATTLVLILLVLSPGISVPILNAGGGSGGLSEPVSVTNAYLGSIPDIQNELSTNNFLQDGTFTNENFAQEDTLSAVDTNTQNLQNQIDNIETLIGEDGRSTDSFGTLITKGTKSLIDVPSTNPYSPERLRLLIDGQRENLLYNTVSEYTKKVDHHRLVPDPGERVTLETAESTPYVVNYEIWYSWSLQVNRTLQEGDKIRVGAFSDENGYFLEKNHTQSDKEILAKVRRNGSTVVAEEVTLEKPLTDWTRFELQSNWYGVGEQVWTQSHTNLSRTGSPQYQEIMGYTAPEGDRLNSPETPTLANRFEIVRGSNSDAIRLEAGSTSAMVAGDIDLLNRVKTDRFVTAINSSALDSWQPVAAFRIDPDDEYVRAELIDVDFAEIEADTDGQVIAQQHEPGLVVAEGGDNLSVDTGWDTPNLHNPENSIIQFRSDVVKAPNGTGTPVLSAGDVGGFQVGWGSIYSTGNKGSASSSSAARLRPVYGSDVTVFWIKMDNENNPNTPTDVTIEYTVEMDY